MPTNQQRREAERRRLQRQLEERRARQAAHKRTTFIVSIAGTLVVIAAVVIAIVATTGGSDKKKTPPQAQNQPSTTSSPASSPAASSTPPAAPVTIPTKPCAPPAKGAKAKFEGVTVTGGRDVTHAPKVASLSESAPSTLQCEDLVVGKGKPATASSTVSVQYAGVLYKNGTAFDSSWTNNKGKPVQFPLANVVAGFKQGIGGAGKVAPMRVGGRRLMILPAALGYGAQANGPIPANSPLVFVVDLVSVTG